MPVCVFVFVFVCVWHEIWHFREDFMSNRSSGKRQDAPRGLSAVSRSEGSLCVAPDKGKKCPERAALIYLSRRPDLNENTR